MSYTTIKAIYPGDKTEDLQQLPNSHGSAPLVWDAMCQRYLGTGEFGYFEEINDLWPLWKDVSIPKHHRAVLMMTYDRAYVTKEHYARAASDIRAFLSDFPRIKERANHWPTIASLFESNPDVPAIGLWCTSVSEDPFQGEWDEEKEQYGPPDWEECYSLYELLDSITG